MTRTTIECHPSGTFFDFADPQPEMIHVEDIARALSQINRFGGHTRFPYSVAQHALLVARLVRETGGSPELQFAALHHDSHEAYLGDVPTPLKDLIKARAPEVWESLANAVDAAIESRFGIFHQLSLFEDDIVKAADVEARRIEAHVLKVSGTAAPHEPWVGDVPTGAVKRMEPEWAEHLFLAAHRRLACSITR